MAEALQVLAWCQKGISRLLSMLHDHSIHESVDKASFKRTATYKECEDGLSQNGLAALLFSVAGQSCNDNPP